MINSLKNITKDMSDYGGLCAKRPGTEIKNMGDPTLNKNLQGPSPTTVANTLAQKLGVLWGGRPELQMPHVEKCIGNFLQINSLKNITKDMSDYGINSLRNITKDMSDYGGPKPI